MAHAPAKTDSEEYAEYTKDKKGYTDKRDVTKTSPGKKDRK